MVMVRIDVGAGKHPKEGYLSVDAYADADIEAEMWDLPFEDGEVTAIYSSHALEHIPKAMVMPTLKEWFRVLQKGGTVEVRVPDLRWVCRNWLEKQTNDWHMDAIFGNQTDEGQFHKTGYTPDLLRRYLEQAGFEVTGEGIIWSHNQDTLVAYARKP